MSEEKINFKDGSAQRRRRRARARAMVQILGSGGFAARLARFGGGAAAGARSASDASGRFSRANASRIAVTTTCVEIKI